MHVVDQRTVNETVQPVIETTSNVDEYLVEDGVSSTIPHVFIGTYMLVALSASVISNMLVIMTYIR